MRLMLRTMATAGVLTVGGLLAAAGLAHAGGCCGGGGSYRGGPTYGRTNATASYGGASCCAMPGMSTGEMQMPMQRMGGMPIPTAAVQAPAAPMPGTNMGGYAAPAAATYYCPMHPNVVSSTPATCPVCRMALQKK